MTALMREWSSSMAVEKVRGARVAEVRRKGVSLRSEGRVSWEGGGAECAGLVVVMTGPVGSEELVEGLLDGRKAEAALGKRDSNGLIGSEASEGKAE